MFKKIALIGLLGFNFAAYSTPSDNVDVIVAPGKPIVYTAPYAINFPGGKTQTIDAPWFLSQVSIDNHSGQQVTIVGAKFDVQLKNGNQHTTIFSPTTYSYTLACKRGTTADLNFSDFGTFADGQKGTLGLTYRTPDLLPADCKGQAPVAFPASFYVGSLPVGVPGVYEYSVRLTLVGWFGSLITPNERLDKSFDFSTR